MEKHDFDLCIARCGECDGINILRWCKHGIFVCKHTGKFLKQTDETTLREMTEVSALSK